MVLAKRTKINLNSKKNKLDNFYTTEQINRWRAVRSSKMSFLKDAQKTIEIQRRKTKGMLQPTDVLNLVEVTIVMKEFGKAIG